MTGANSIGADAVGAAKASLDRDGYAIVENVGSGALMERIAAEVEPALEALSEARAGYYGGRTRRCGALLARSPALVELLATSAIIDVVEAALHPYCPQVLLAGSNGHEISPDGEEQPLHRDEGVWYPYVQRRPGGPEYCLNVMLAVTDFTRENGATRLVAGSNHWPAERRPQPDQPLSYLEMPRGSAGFWFGSTFHGASINRTGRPRLGITIPFNVGWLRPIEAQHLVMPPQKARGLPKQLLSALGYEACNNVIGKVNWRSPMHLVSDDPAYQRQII
jgi:ectoine hydroxylase-related dioxygenase (phytanoyl-CoA dioxygenase family)